MKNGLKCRMMSQTSGDVNFITTGSYTGLVVTERTSNYMLGFEKKLAVKGVTNDGYEVSVRCSLRLNFKILEL